jgi:carboxyl-terminal processing protease
MRCRPDGRRSGNYYSIHRAVKLPGQIEVEFPIGASLNAKRQIQLDSNGTGSGGVPPQIRISRTYDNMLAIGQGQDVELREAQRELTRR